MRLFSKKLRGAIIGFGNVVEQIHWPAFSNAKNIEIVAITDISEKRRLILKDRFPHIKIYDDYKNLLSLEEIDFVDIATPPYVHTEIILSASERNIHTICEKPIVINADDIETIRNAAIKNKTVIFPILNYKLSPLVKKIKEIVQSGGIGKIETITLNVFRPSHREGVSEWFPHWRRQKKYAGGGVLMDYGPHVFSLISFLSNEKPEKITTGIVTLDKRWPETDDNAFIWLKFSTMSANINLSWTAKNRAIIYTMAGSKGFLISNNNVLDIFTSKKSSREIYEHFLPVNHPNWFSLILQDFIRAIRNKDYQNRELQEALDGAKLISKAYQLSRNKSESTLL